MLEVNEIVICLIFDDKPGDPDFTACFRTLVLIHPVWMKKCVMNPALKLKISVPAKRHMAKSKPMVPTLKKKISGSIEGDAIQNAITGGRGTPPISNAAITGITPHEQKGLKAPTRVASKIAVIGPASKARFMYFEAPDIFTATAIGMVITRYGQM